MTHLMSRAWPHVNVPNRHADINSVSVRHRPHLIDVSLSHLAPAYVDEEYPITVSVTNVDEHNISVVVDVLLQPGEDDTGVFSGLMYPPYSMLM